MYRAPYYNRNPNMGPRIDSNLGQSPCPFVARLLWGLCGRGQKQYLVEREDNRKAIWILLSCKRCQQDITFHVYFLVGASCFHAWLNNHGMSTNDKDYQLLSKTARFEATCWGHELKQGRLDGQNLATRTPTASK